VKKTGDAIVRKHITARSVTEAVIRKIVTGDSTRQPSKNLPRDNKTTPVVPENAEQSRSNKTQFKVDRNASRSLS
jgi:hypothetical protein